MGRGGWIACYVTTETLSSSTQQDVLVAARIVKPVKPRIDRIGRPERVNSDWEEVPPGVHVQRCMTERGVFAVVEDSVRLV